MSTADTGTDTWLQRAWAQGFTAPVLVPLASLAIALLVGLSPLHRPLSNLLGDALWRATAGTKHYTNVLAVDIDEASLRELQPLAGGWPLERDLHALVVKYLREAGAATVALDIVFADPRDNDTALAAALQGQPPVVLAAAGTKRAFNSTIDAPNRTATLLDRTTLDVNPGSPAFEWPSMVLPHAGLFGAGPGGPVLGVVSMPLDTDGTLRRMPVLHRVDGRLVPMLPVVMAQSMLGSKSLRFNAGEQTFSAGSRAWPVDTEGALTIAQPRNEDSVTILPFARLARAALGQEPDAAVRELVVGRAVIVGSSAFPGDAIMTQGGQVSGLRWITTVTGALLAGDVLRPAAWWAAFPLWVLALSPAALAWRRERLSGAAAAAIAAAAILAVLAASGALRSFASLQVDPLLPLVLALSGLVLTLVARQHALAVAHRRADIERAVSDASNRAKSEFLANVSHEIRTPMSAVLGVADLLSETELNPVQRRHVEVFRRSGEALARLIDDLLDLSKIEAGRIELERTEFGLAHLVRDQVALLRPRAEAKGIHLGLKIAPGLRNSVFGDRLRLTQVLVNLLSNAIKFTARGGVSLEVGEDDSDPALIRFTITDTGIGIDASKLDRIFEPFMQADASVTREYGGTGLGLTITKRLIEMMGGRITVRSTPGSGSEFSFVVTLPEAPATVATRRASPAGAAPAAVPAPGLAVGRDLSILLADDNATNLYLVQSMLQDPAIVIDTVTNGREALDRLAAHRYDLVLMDLQMPVLDGLSATREWRRLEALSGLPRTPVIALTANAFESDRRRSLEAGCDDHLAKPLRKATLVRAVIQWANPAGGPGREPAVAGSSDDALDVRHFDALAVLEGHGVLDVAAAVDRLGGNMRLYLGALARLLPSLGDWRARFDAALNAGDKEMAQMLAHDLKGVLGSVGATRAAAAAAALEEITLHASAERREAALAAVDAELTPLRSLIRVAVDHVKGASAAPAPTRQ